MPTKRPNCARSYEIISFFVHSRSAFVWPAEGPVEEKFRQRPGRPLVSDYEPLVGGFGYAAHGRGTSLAGGGGGDTQQFLFSEKGRSRRP
jgi:hypothetical protein